MSNFINHNGNFLLSDAPVVSANNRSFRYGDALFETIRIANYNVQYLKEHMERLYKGMDVLKMDNNPLLNSTFIEYAILELAQKNDVTSDGRVRLTVFRNDGGFYAPSDNSTSFLLEVNSLDEEGYILNTKGYALDLYTEYKKPINALSSIKSANSIIYVMAGIYKTKQKLDECLLLNEKHHIIEAISSNIFAVKNGVLYTPPVSDGCINGVMRKKIIEIAIANKIAVHENSITQSILLAADELFLSNTINGIRWVTTYKQKRYFNKTSKILIDKLNELILVS